MKCVQIRPGRSVFVSSEMAEKAAHAFAEASFTRAEVEQMGSLEPKRMPTVLLGGNVRRSALHVRATNSNGAAHQGDHQLRDRKGIEE